MHKYLPVFILFLYAFILTCLSGLSVAFLSFLTANNPDSTAIASVILFTVGFPWWIFLSTTFAQSLNLQYWFLETHYAFWILFLCTLNLSYILTLCLKQLNKLNKKDGGKK